MSLLLVFRRQRCCSNRGTTKASPNCVLKKTKGQRLCGKRLRDDKDANLETMNSIEAFSFQYEESNNRNTNLERERILKGRDRVNLCLSDKDTNKFQSPIKIKEKNNSLGE